MNFFPKKCEWGNLKWAYSHRNDDGVDTAASADRPVVIGTERIKNMGEELTELCLESDLLLPISRKYETKRKKNESG